MSSNETETNGYRLQSKNPRLEGVLDRRTLVVIMRILSLVKRRKWTSQENKIVVECSLLSKPKIRG